MIDVPMADLRGRVLVSRERVKFADADPYADLAPGAYVDMIMGAFQRIGERRGSRSLTTHDTENLARVR